MTNALGHKPLATTYALPVEVTGQIAQLRSAYQELMQIAADAGYDFDQVPFLGALFQAYQLEVGQLIHEAVAASTTADGKMAVTLTINKHFPELRHWHEYESRAMMHQHFAETQRQVRRVIAQGKATGNAVKVFQKRLAV